MDDLLQKGLIVLHHRRMMMKFCFYMKIIPGLHCVKSNGIYARIDFALRKIQNHLCHINISFRSTLKKSILAEKYTTDPEATENLDLNRDNVMFTDESSL